MWSSYCVLCCSYLLLWVVGVSVANYDSGNTIRYHGHNARHCPATSSLYFDIDGYFPYPLDLFDPNALKLYLSHSNSSSMSHHSSKHRQSHHFHHPSSSHHNLSHHDLDYTLYNCTSQMGKIFKKVDLTHPKHICSPYLPMACPLIEENAFDATKRAHDWIYPDWIPSNTLLPHLRSTDSIQPHHLAVEIDVLMKELVANQPYLLHIWQALSDATATIRVFILGGSAAEGADSMGCLCNEKYDHKCPILSYIHDIQDLPESCRWGNIFVKWLQSIALAKIRVHYFTKGGTDSVYASETFIDDLHMNFNTKTTIAKFNQYDLLLLDYALNDGLTHFKKNSLYLLESQLEWLFRQIHLNTDEHATGLPAMLLLESYPFTGMDKIQPYTKGNMPSVDYAKIYTKIAKYYRIPIISLRDMLWSNASMTKQASYHEYMTAKDHPLWFQHYIAADLYASVFAKELREAQIFHSYIERLKDAQKLPSNAFNGTMRPALPPALVKEDVTSLCDPNIRPLLDLTAADLHPPKGSKSTRKYARIGKFDVTLSTRNPDGQLTNEERTKWFEAQKQQPGAAPMWRLEEDRPGKVGWIDEYFNTSEYFPTIPSFALEHSLIFHLDDPNEEYFKFAHLISVQYLKTYHNTGVFHIHFCGMNFEFLHDRIYTYFTDTTNHISITQIVSKITNQIPKNICDKHRQELFASSSSKYHNSSGGFIEIAHVPIQACLDPKDKNCGHVTTKQKVKIMSIKVCRLADAKFEGSY